MTTPLITLLSDFGFRDPYVAEMKAVILTISPTAKIIDISHSIDKFNIRMGAFILASAAPYFPEDTIHIAVADPGVGTRRRALIIKTQHAYYIGPDNGVLTLASQKEGIRHVNAITNAKFMLSRVSSTFHARDIFAPAAAYLATGVKPASFGPEIKDFVIPKFTKATIAANAITGEVLHVDDFGNTITNITREDLEKTKIKPQSIVRVELGNKSAEMKYVGAYGEVPLKSLMALIGGHDFLEIAANQGNASEKLGMKSGDAVVVSLSQ